MKSVVVKMGLSIIFLLLVVLFPLGYVVNGVFSTFYYQKAYQEMETQSNKLVRLISGVTDATAAPSIVLAMDMVNAGVILLDETKKQVAKTNTNIQTQELITDDEWKALKAGGSLSKNWASPGYALIGKSIIKNGIFSGAVLLVKSAEDIETSLVQIRNTLLFIGLGGILLALGFTMILVRKLSIPLLDMERATRAIATGDLDIRVVPPSNDELGSLARAINDLARNLKQYEDTRREFFANISHELRTPMTYIEGYVRLLKESQSDEERNQTIDIIVDETKRLKALVNDLFDLSKLEEGKISLTLEWLDLYEVVESAIEKVRHRADQKGIHIKVGVEDIPLMFLDGYRMQQVFLNLLDNAIRYTDKGTVSVSVKQCENNISIKVEDTGMGIPPEDVPHIFERFHRVEKSRSREHGGTGLGLAIVKRLIELQGGDIEVIGKEGIGTTFTINFPIPDREMEE